MRYQSKKTARMMRLRRIAVDIALERDMHCRGLDLIPFHVCHGPLVGHEPLKRSAGGDACDPGEVMIVCWRLNEDIEIYPNLARQFGLSKSMGTRYAEGRLVRRHPSIPGFKP